MDGATSPTRRVSAPERASAPQLTLSAAWSWAWDMLKQHFPLFLAIQLVLFGAWILLELAVIGGQRLGIVWWATSHLAFLLFAAAVKIGLLRVCLRLRDGHPAAVGDAFTMLRDGPRFFVAQLCFALMVLAGFLLLIVPGFYLAARFGFFGFALAEGGRGVVPPLRASWRLTDGSALRLALLLFGLVLFNVLGACFLGIGLLLTAPLTLLMLAALYRQLQPSVTG
jgi:membrane-anchored glycerophosphoryl diester phosphodiesterase (GDPDase)